VENVSRKNNTLRGEQWFAVRIAIAAAIPAPVQVKDEMKP
jgi:hypothetical protein